MRLARWLAYLALACAAGAVHAQAYPAKAVRIIVPFSPGGATDIVTRLLAQKLTAAWGQQVVADNRAGASGNIGGELAAKAAPDGYTLFMTSGSVVTANQHLFRKMSFNRTRTSRPSPTSRAARRSSPCIPASPRKAFEG